MEENFNGPRRGQAAIAQCLITRYLYYDLGPVAIHQDTLGVREALGVIRRDPAPAEAVPECAVPLVCSLGVRPGVRPGVTGVLGVKVVVLGVPNPPLDP